MCKKRKKSQKKKKKKSLIHDQGESSSLGVVVLGLRGTQKPLITKHGHQTPPLPSLECEAQILLILKPKTTSQVWRCMSLSPVFGRQRQVDLYVPSHHDGHTEL